MKTTKPTFPRTAADLLQCLERTDRLHLWTITSIPAERDDEQEMRTTFYLTGHDPLADARVAFEHGRLIITLADEFWFALERMFDHEPGWSWQQQVGGRSYGQARQLALLDQLCAALAEFRPRPKPAQQRTASRSPSPSGRQ